MNEITCKPEIRFKNFNEQWSKKELWEYTIWDKQFNEVEKEKQPKIIKYPYLLADDFKKIEVSNGDVQLLSTGQFVGYTTKEKAGEYLCNGEVVTIPWGGTPNIKYYNGFFVTTDNRIATSSNNKVLKNKFLYYYLNHNLSFIESIYRGASIKHPSMNDLLNMKIYLPSVEEQDKISDLLGNIDKLIDLNQRKYDKLLNIKKTMLNKLFLQKFEKKPKIRFKGFNDEWEQTKLGNIILETIDNRGKNPPYYCDSGIPVIDNFMIKNNGYPDLKSATRFLDNYLYENFVRKYNELDDTLITLVGNGIGNIALFPKEKSAIIQNTLGMRFEKPKKFKYYSLLSKNAEIVKLDRGMAQPSIRQDELKNIDIELPLFDEQMQISKFMSNLDNLIALNQNKIEKLNNIKKTMLNKLFV